MLKRLPFLEWLPDQPLVTSTVLNAWPLPDGYRPVKSFGAITPALAGWSGGAAFVGSDGTASLLSGTATDLHRYSGGAWTSALGSLSASHWRFTQFGDNVVCVNGAAPVKYNLLLGTAAALAGSPPVSDMCATVRDFVWLAGDPSDVARLSISGFNDSEGWTPGTNQSTTQPMLDGGAIMGLAGGEYGVILQRGALRRGTYVGGDLIWQFDLISSNVGCMAKGSVAQADKLVFFLSERGFMVYDGAAVTPIGTEKVDRTFFGAYSRSDIESGITCAIDPRQTIVMWAMPGNPGRGWAFNWTLNRWAPIEVSMSGVFSGFTANTSLDALDALYPGGIDAIPYSLDDPIFAGGNPLFLIADAEGAVGTLSGANLPAAFGISPIELLQGRRARVRTCRAVSDAIEGTVTLDNRARAGDPPARRVSGSIRANGAVPIRANGRHMGVELGIPAGAEWSYVKGVDLEFEAEGTR